MLTTTTNFDAKHDADNKTPVYIIEFSDLDVVFGSPGADEAVGEDITTGLYLYYPMDETSGTDVPDSGSGSNDGTTSGSPSWVSGKTSNGLDLDGSDDYVDVGATLQSIFRDSFSVSLWMQCDSGSTYAHLFSAADSNNFVYIYMSARRLWLNYGDGTNSASLGGTANLFPSGADTQFRHIVATFESGVGIKAYYDAAEEGNEAGEGDFSSLTMANYTSSNNPYIGARNLNGSPASYFNGKMDEVRVYSRVLTAAEVTALYNNG